MGDVSQLRKGSKDQAISTLALLILRPNGTNQPIRAAANSRGADALAYPLKRRVANMLTTVAPAGHHAGDSLADGAVLSPAAGIFDRRPASYRATLGSKIGYRRGLGR
jgi:hypothetical protein